MLQNQTCTYQGSEVCLFPLSRVNVTQISSPTSYSHCCGNAVDYGEPYNTPCYAPFSGTITSYTTGSNAINFVSDNPVWTLRGLTYVTARFLHSNQSYTQGRHVNQGEILYYTGNWVNGQYGQYHLHLDQSDVANDIVWYYFPCQSGWGDCWALKESCPAEEIFYLTGDETIVTTMGLNFQQWTGSPIVLRSNFKWFLYKDLFGGTSV